MTCVSSSSSNNLFTTPLHAIRISMSVWDCVHSFYTSSMTIWKSSHMCALNSKIAIRPTDQMLCLFGKVGAVVKLSIY